MKRLRVGIVGCGRILPMHIVSVVHLPQAELVAVCDIVQERAAQAARKYGGKVYTDYKEMIEKENLDVLHVCLPHYLHSVVSEYALSHGVNVLSEKPMSIRYEDGERCVKVAEENGVLYGVIFQCRYNNSAKMVKAALTDGKLGKILCARSTLTWARPDDYYASSDWKGTWDKEGGGVIIDQAIHSMDLINWFVDSEVERVSCSIANRGHKLVAVEDSAEGLVTYKNGVKYGFYCMNNYACDEPIELRLFCENGKVVMDYDNAEIRYNNGEIERVHLDNPDIEYEGGKDYWGFQHIRQIEQFYNSVLGKEELQISGKEALKIQKLICAMYESGKSGKEITF